MGGVYWGDNLQTALVMGEFVRLFEQAFVGLATAVAEEAFARSNEVDEGLSEASLGFVIIIVRDVNELARLIDECLGNGRMRMAEGANGNAAAEIEIAFACNIKDVTARAMRQDEVEPPVRGDNILLENGLDGRDIVAHDGRRRRSDFFHALHVIRNRRKL